MADNKLTITAELLDRVSPAARQMQKSFDALSKATSKDLPAAFRKYQLAVNAQEKALQSYGRRSEGVRKEIRAFQEIVMRTSPTIGRLTESLGAFSTGSGAAVTAVGAMGAALIVAGKQAADFALSMKEIKFGAADTGLQPLQLQQTQQVLHELGLSAAEVTANLTHLQEEMTDASRNTGEFINSIKDPTFRGLAYELVDMAAHGATADKVLLRVIDQLDGIKARFPGATGSDISRRYLGELGLDPRLARTTGQEFRDRMEYSRTHGTTAAEMKDALENSEIFNKRLFEGEVALGRMADWAKTDLLTGFVKINNILESIYRKYSGLFGSSSSDPFGGRGYGGGSTVGGGASGSGPQGAGPRQYGGSHGGGAGAGATRRPGPQFRKGVGPGARYAGGAGTGADPRGLESYIREQAALNHVDPNVAMTVAGAEGLSNPVGDRGQSHGAFQLYSGGGLGNEFQKETGLDPADPKNERATIAWALKRVGQTHDWSPWHGAARVGVGRNEGFDYTGPAGGPGSAGEGDYVGTGGYNFMGSERARQMGMGDVTGAGALAHMEFPTGIPKGEGPGSITANKYAGADMAGFLKDLHDAGAPLGDFAGAYVPKRLGRGWSQHAYGNALDIETGFGSGPDNSAALYAWSQAHPKEFAEIQALHHMRNLDTSSGAGMHDWGHFEWTPQERAVAGSLAQDRVNFNAGLSGTPAKIGGSGNVHVEVAAVGKTARSQGLFKNLNQHRYKQMEPAAPGPVQAPAPFA